MTDLSRHAARRALLAQRMHAGVAILPTAPERIRNRDSDYLYRYDSYFYHLTGFPEPEAVLVVVAGAAPKTLLFCREKNPERELWDGFRHGPEAARELFGVDETASIATLDEAMPRLLANQRALFYAPGADPGWDARVMNWLNQVRAQSRTGVTAPNEIRDVRAVTAIRSVAPRPALIMHGSEDDTVPVYDARVLADAHGSADLRIIEGGAHQLRHDPRAVAVLLGWLDRQRAAAAAERAS